LRGTQAPVASYDAAGIVDQDRVGPAELADAGRYLLDLCRRMRPRIASVGQQIPYRPVLDGEF
jgi:hypothetical protein